MYTLMPPNDSFCLSLLEAENIKSEPIYDEFMHNTQFQAINASPCSTVVEILHKFSEPALG